MSASQSHSCQYVLLKLEILVASLEDFFEAEAALDAIAALCSEAGKWSSEMVEYRRRLIERQQELAEINAELEAVLDTELDELFGTWPDGLGEHDLERLKERQDRNRSELMDLIHSLPDLEVGGGQQASR